MEKSSPPTGAPNAEATPAAAPAEMKLRLFEEFAIVSVYFKIFFKSCLLFFWRLRHLAMA